MCEKKSLTLHFNSLYYHKINNNKGMNQSCVATNSLIEKNGKRPYTIY